MPLFKFEIVQTVHWLPDPSAYPFGKAHSQELQGAAMVVLKEFDDEEIARNQECTHDEGWKSDVWHEYCPHHFKNLDSIGGLDVTYIGQATETDIERASGGDFWNEDAIWHTLMLDRQEEERHVHFESIERAPLRHLKRKRSRQ